MVSFVAQLKHVIRPMFQNGSLVQHCVHSTCWCDGVGYGILQSIQGSCWHIDASWLNVNERWCCVCQRGLGCNLSAEPARSPNDIIRKCRQQCSNEEWSDARCFTSLLLSPTPFLRRRCCQAFRLSLFAHRSDKIWKRDEEWSLYRTHDPKGVNIKYNNDTIREKDGSQG